MNFFFFEIILILSIIYLGALLLSGILLFVKSRKEKIPNLIYLALHPLIQVIAFIFSMISSHGSISSLLIFFTISYFFIEMSLVSLTIFIHKTFYNDKKSLFPIILSFNLLAAIILPILRFIRNTYNPIWFYYTFLGIQGTSLIITGWWFAKSALIQYSLIKNEAIENWVKKRYLVAGISSIFLVFNGISILFFPYIESGVTLEQKGISQSIIVALIMTIISVIYSIGYLYAWVILRKNTTQLNQNKLMINDLDLFEEEIKRMEFKN